MSSGGLVGGQWPHCAPPFLGCFVMVRARKREPPEPPSPAQLRVHGVQPDHGESSQSCFGAGSVASHDVWPVNPLVVEPKAQGEQCENPSACSVVFVKVSTSHGSHASAFSALEYVPAGHRAHFGAVRLSPQSPDVPVADTQ